LPEPPGGWDLDGLQTAARPDGDGWVVDGGGIGFTWEHDAHLNFKRAKASELLLGDPARHREMLLKRIGV
jgi:alkylation response protein AidB-like acyl-CoA dehydrogenase